MTKECPVRILPDPKLQLRPVEPSTGLFSLDAESDGALGQRRSVGEIEDGFGKISLIARNGVFGRSA